MSPLESQKITRQSEGHVRASPILVTAALSVAALITATGAHFGNTAASAPIVPARENLEVIEPRTYLAISDEDQNGNPDWYDELIASGIEIATSTYATTSDPISTLAESVAGTLYGQYLALKQEGSYSTERGETLAETIAANIRAPLLSNPLTVTEVVSRENSAAAALEYRAEMRTALAPLVNDDPPELEYFAQYLNTREPAWLTKLDEAAKRYRSASENMLAIAVPEAAIPEHLRALNALRAYAETLERLAAHGDDALASVALLKTMNESEKEILTAFNGLAQYYVRTATN